MYEYEIIFLRVFHRVLTDLTAIFQSANTERFFYVQEAKQNFVFDLLTLAFLLFFLKHILIKTHFNILLEGYPTEQLNSFGKNTPTVSSI